MKKTFKIINLECAHCAAKMEHAIRKLDGVSHVSISFLLQKATIEADDTQFDEIAAKAADICKKIEPDCLFTER